MEEPTETRPAGAEDLTNGAREPEGPPPEVEEEEVEEEAKAALGSEGSRPFTMRELLGDPKEDGETAAGSSSARSTFGDGNGVGSANAEGSSYRRKVKESRKGEDDSGYSWRVKMKYMKLGSKPDVFQTEENSIRFVTTELATDIVITVGDVKFYLHKFPLLSKSSRLQTLVASTSEESNDKVDISDIPGGLAAFEICAKFYYGMVVTLNANNVVAARCAAEYLEMFETVDKGNLVYKIDVFLSASIFRTWKDSIIVLQSTKSLHQWTERAFNN